MVTFDRVKALHVATGTALAAAVLWGGKAIAIALAGGRDRSSLEAPLYALGLLAIVLACAALGVAVTSGRGTRVWVKVLAGLGGVAAGVLLFPLVEGATEALVPVSAGWVHDEAGLWTANTLTLALAVAWLRGQDESAPDSSGVGDSE